MFDFLPLPSGAATANHLPPSSPLSATDFTSSFTTPINLPCALPPGPPAHQLQPSNHPSTPAQSGLDLPNIQRAQLSLCSLSHRNLRSNLQLCKPPQNHTTALLRQSPPHALLSHISIFQHPPAVCKAFKKSLRLHAERLSKITNVKSAQ